MITPLQLRIFYYEGRGPSGLNRASELNIVVKSVLQEEDFLMSGENLVFYD